MAKRVPHTAFVLINKKILRALFLFQSYCINFVYHSMLAKHQGKVGLHIQFNEKKVRSNYDYNNNNNFYFNNNTLF